MHVSSGRCAAGPRTSLRARLHRAWLIGCILLKSGCMWEWLRDREIDRSCSLTWPTARGASIIIERGGGCAAGAACAWEIRSRSVAFGVAARSPAGQALLSHQVDGRGAPIIIERGGGCCAAGGSGRGLHCRRAAAIDSNGLQPGGLHLSAVRCLALWASGCGSAVPRLGNTGS
jgi:hypothetical protein